MRFLRFDFLTSSVFAKVVNWMTNAAAVFYFVNAESVVYEIAVPLALSNMLGNLLGARFAILKGNQYVRKFFLIVVVLMIGRFAWEVL